jgi:beta-N-acetylhexosaminidase
MEGAGAAGGIVARADAAWSAGCDMLPVCNAPERVDELLAAWRPAPDARRAARIARLLPSPGVVPDLRDDPRYLAGVEAAARLA